MTVDLSVLEREWTLAPERPVHSRTCLWCGTALSGRQRDYCKDSHRKMANRQKWQLAVGAVVDVLRQWTDVDVSTLLTVTTRVFDWCADTRHPERQQQRAGLMQTLGLSWDNGSRAWQSTRQ